MDIRLHDHQVIIAACQQNAQLLCQLIDDHNIAVTERVTMLWQACALGELQLVEEFLQHSECNLNFQRASDNVSCIYIAAQNGHAVVCTALLQRGAMVNIQRNTKATPLFIAVQRNNTRVVEVLLQFHADPEVENDQRCTPLVLACNMGHSEAASLLMRAGCRLFHRRTGLSPLMWCRRENRLETLEVVENWILETKLNPMFKAILLSRSFGTWVLFASAAQTRRQLEERQKKDEAAAAERSYQLLHEGGPLPSIVDLSEFEFSGKLHRPRLDELPQGMRVRDERLDTPSRIDAEIVQTQAAAPPSASPKRLTHDVLNFFATPTVPHHHQVRSPPSTSKAFDRQQKIRNIMNGTIDSSQSALFSDVLCTQHFR